jgi:hypothetical protein
MGTVCDRRTSDGTDPRGSSGTLLLAGCGVWQCSRKSLGRPSRNSWSASSAATRAVDILRWKQTALGDIRPEVPDDARPGVDSDGLMLLQLVQGSVVPSVVDDTDGIGESEDWL